MFKVDVDALSAAAADASSAAGRAAGSVGRVARANTGFAGSASGTWAFAESRAYADLEVTLRLLAEGLSATGEALSGALASAEGDVVPARDAALAAASSEAASPAVARLEPYHNVAGACDFAAGSLGDLGSAVSAARAALDGLESSGGVSEPLSSLSETLPSREVAIEDMRSSYLAYEAAVDAFEEEYADRLDPGSFVTGAMEASVAADLRAQYGAALSGGPFALIDPLGDVSAALAGVAGVAGELDSADLAWLRFAADGLFGPGGKGVPLPERLDRALFAAWAAGADGIKGLASNRSELWGLFKKNIKSEVFDWVRPSRWQDSIDAAKDLVGGLGEKAHAAYSGSQRPGKVLRGSFEAFDSLADYADDAVKSLGYAGTALSAVDTIAQAGAAYNSTVGDGYDKTAAVVVEVGEGLVEFGTGAAVGAALGTIGGPVGVAAGVAIGWAAGELLDAGLRWFDESGLKGKAVDGIGDAFRAVGDFFGM